MPIRRSFFGNFGCYNNYNANHPMEDNILQILTYSFASPLLYFTHGRIISIRLSVQNWYNPSFPPPPIILNEQFLIPMLKAMHSELMPDMVWAASDDCTLSEDEVRAYISSWLGKCDLWWPVSGSGQVWRATFPQWWTYYLPDSSQHKFGSPSCYPTPLASQPLTYTIA